VFGFMTSQDKKMFGFQPGEVQYNFKK